MISDSTLNALVGAGGGLLGGVLGSGGLYAWLKLGPERRKITIEAARDAVVIHGEVLEDIREDQKQLREELGQVKMESLSREREHGQCEKKIAELERSIDY